MMRAFRFALLACTSAFVAACGADSTSETMPAQGASAIASNRSGAATPSIFDALQTAALATPYSGTRRVWSRAESTGRAQQLEYSERIACDGAGHFSIETKDLQQPRVSAAQFDVFQLLQKGREAFLFRYRDFHVRDSARMLQNYQVDHTGQVAVIAGRACEVLVFARTPSATGRPAGGYRIAVDAATKVVLRWEEFDERGATIASMEFDSITFAPPPAATVYHTDLPATVFDPHTADTQALLGFALDTPTLVQGFQLARAERLELQGRVWARLLYHDGIEPFFFMQSGARQLAAARATTPRTDAGMPVVRVFEAGAWTVAQCSFDGAEYILAGKAPESFVVAALQSALR